MNSNNLRDLFQNTNVVDIEEAIEAAQRASDDPAAARTLWHLLLAVHGSDQRFHMTLQWILESVLVDQISNRVLSDDEFALVIGRRIAVLIERLSAVPRDTLTRAA